MQETGAGSVGLIQRAEEAGPSSPLRQLKELGKSMGPQGAELLPQFYDGKSDTAQYGAAFMAYYHAGEVGGKITAVKNEYAQFLEPHQREQTYRAGQADAQAREAALGVEGTPLAESSPLADNTMLAESGKTSYTENATGISDLGGQLAIRDVATVNGIKYALRQAGDGQYFLTIDRDSTFMGGYISDARSHIYDAGPFATRSEAVQNALDVARKNKLAEQLEPARGGQDAGGLLGAVAAQNVQEDESGGDAGKDLGGRGLPAGRPASGSDAAGVPGGRGLGSGEGGDLRTPAGVSVEERLAAKEAKLKEIQQKYGLTDDEAWAVTEYKSAESYKINAKLRAGTELNDLQKKIVQNLDSALAKLPKVDGTVYRTLSFDDMSDGQEEYDTFLAQHQKGAYVGYKAYTSTSTKAGGHPLADGTKLGVTLEITGSSARNLDGFGNNFEGEALYKRRSSFFVTDIGKDRKGHPYIKMTEVIEGEQLRPEEGHSEERGVAVRDVQEAQGVRSDVRSIPAENPGKNSVGRRDLQGARGEVTEETPAPATTEEQTAEKAVAAAEAQEAEKKYGIAPNVYLLLQTKAADMESLRYKDGLPKAGEAIPKSKDLQIMEAVYSIPGLSDKQRTALFNYLGVDQSVRHYNKAAVKEHLDRMRQRAAVPEMQEAFDPFEEMAQSSTGKPHANGKQIQGLEEHKSTAQKGGEARVSMKGKNPYAGKSLSADSTIYSYDFLTDLPDMKVTTLPEVSTVRNADGKVDTHAVVEAGMENARAVGTEQAGKVFVRNTYTQKPLMVTTNSIRHGLNGGLNRLLTNARLGAVIGEVVQNAVPINALKNKAPGVTGTYAMAGYATDSQGREFVAIVTIEQKSGQVTSIEAYDMLHAVSGRQKNGS